MLKLALGIFAVALQGAGQFSDVPSGHWAYNAVLSMRSEGVLSGYPEPKRVNYYFAFLVAGSEKAPKDKAEGDQMFQAHLGNLKDRYKEGKLIAAGPLNDPGKSRRGIAVLTLDEKENPAQMFLHDPYVQKHIMEVEAYRWDPRGAFGGSPDPEKLAENRLIVVHGLNIPSQKKILRDSFRRAYFEHLLSVYGETIGARDVIGLALANNTNDVFLHKAFADLPIGMRAEVIPVWLSKGTIK